MPAPLFTYGTLMNPATQQEVMGRGCPVIAAKIKGYRVMQGKWPYLVSAANEDVTGLLLLELDADDYTRLDQYEDVSEGLYTRQSVMAEAEDGWCVECFVYLPTLDKWPADWR